MYSLDENYFKVIDTEDKAYWLGFLYADGSITRFYKTDKKTGEKVIRSLSLELGLQSGDKHHLEKFLESIKCNVPIQDRVIRKKYSACRVVVNRTSFCNHLIDKGCVPCKSLILNFPTEDIVPKELLVHFIRGYFDGDGCVHCSENEYYHKERKKTYSQYSFTACFTGNENFLRKMKEVLEQQGIKVGELQFDKRSNAVDIYIHNGDNSLYKFYDLLYRDATVYLDRKYEKFNYAFEKIEEWKQNKK